MRVHLLQQSQDLPISTDEAWAFFSSPRNLENITPDDLGFRIESLLSDELHEGQIITYRVKVAPAVWLPWVTEIKSVEPGVAFVDEQRAGPYRFWHHRHLFEAIPGGCRVRDTVHYALPFGPLGALAHGIFVRRKLAQIFGFRRKVLEDLWGQVAEA